MRRLLLVLLGCGFSIGCSSTPSKPALMANTAKEEITEVTRNRAHQWRLWAAPHARFAAFDQDPLAGAVELWVLAAQQHDYFVDGAGQDWFGSEDPCVPRVTGFLEREAEALAAKVVQEGLLLDVTETVRDWAARHPIEGQLFVRPTARADLAKFFQSESQSALKAFGSLEEVVRDINDRISMLTVQMPVEARWHAEYLIDSRFEDQFEERADSLITAAGDVTLFLDGFEETLAEQTQTLVDGIDTQRVAVFEAIEEERQMILSAVEEGRLSLVSELEDRIDAATEKVETMGKGLIDHFFDRLINLLIVVGVVTFAGVLLVLFIARQMSRRDD